MTDLEESYQHCYNHKAVDDCVRATVYHNCDSGVIFLCGIKNNLLDLLEKGFGTTYLTIYNLGYYMKLENIQTHPCERNTNNSTPDYKLIYPGKSWKSLN